MGLYMYSEQVRQFFFFAEFLVNFEEPSRSIAPLWYLIDTAMSMQMNGSCTIAYRNTKILIAILVIFIYMAELWSKRFCTAGSVGKDFYG